LYSAIQVYPKISLHSEIVIPSINVTHKGVIKMKFDIKSFLADEEGLTTVEYAVAGTLIALAVIAAFRLLGNTVGTKINEIETNLSNG
jgi:pilus assembly protein Flp/PilA